MAWVHRLVGGPDVRPGEGRAVLLALAGAFLALAFLVLARSLREAFFLAIYPARLLPWIMGGTAVASLPAVLLFSHLLPGRDPRRVVAGVALTLGAGLPFLAPQIHAPTAVVIFYGATAIGALLVTSGFWMVVAEAFPLRGARRLFGLIAAGGTIGAVAAGSAAGPLAAHLSQEWLLIVLAGLPLLSIPVTAAMPRPGRRAGEAQLSDPGDESASVAVASEASLARADRGRLGDALRELRASPHLRTIALLVFLSAAASALVDFRFKEAVDAAREGTASLAGLLGTFYAWMGGAALLVQLLVSGRVMASGGIAAALSVLPALLLVGGGGMVLIPALLMAAFVRGADYSLRKSLFRPMLELLYVPLPEQPRRRAKPFVDTIVDGAGEAAGAAVVLAWVTIGGLPSRWLGVAVAGLALLLLWASRRMGRAYFNTISERLRDGAVAVAPPRRGADLLSATFTELDLGDLLRESAAPAAEPAPLASPPAREEPAPALEAPAEPDAPQAAAAGAPPAGASEPIAAQEDPLAALLEGGAPDAEILGVLDQSEARLGSGAIPSLVRLLARDGLHRRVRQELIAGGEAAVPHLVAALGEDQTDFAIRRRIPAILARVGGPEADHALVVGLRADRFEIRYRAAVGLVRRRRRGLPLSRRDWQARIWHSIRLEVRRDRAVWELQRLLDGREEEEESEEERLVARADLRGDLSLEHVFRMLTLVLEPQQVRAAFQGITGEDENLRGLALEYLEQVLPPEVRRRLWPIIGDAAERRREAELRPLEDVVNDLMTTRQTLFGSPAEREALKRMLHREDGGAEAAGGGR